MKRTLALLLALVMCAALFTGCTQAPATKPTETPSTETAQTTEEKADDTKTEEAAATGTNLADQSDGKVWIACITHLTGNYSALGDYQKITNDAWLDWANKNGGILGKEVAIEYFDCVDDIQTAINAFELACEDPRFIAVSLATYSQNCIACIDLADQYKMPTFMGGSGDAINTGNKYVWMTRPLDSAAGQTMTAFMIEQGYSNPIIVHNTLASCQTGAENLALALKDAGINFDENSMMFGYENTETNFAPLVAKLRETGADCLLFFGNQEDGANLSKAIQDAGWDIPRIGNATISHANTVELAGNAINGWYCVAESSVESDNPLNVEWIQVMKDYYGEDFEMTTNYYGCNILNAIKWALETAGSTDDRDLLNETLKQIDMDTANGHLKYFGENDIASQMYVCQMVDQKAVLVKAVSYR